MSLNGGGQKKTFFMVIWHQGKERVSIYVCILLHFVHFGGARCSSMVRVFTHGAMGRHIDPSWWTH